MVNHESPASGIIRRCGIEPSQDLNDRQEQLDAIASLSVRKLSWFVRSCWHAVEPVELTWNWHHEVICDALDRVSSTEGAHELVICIPPGEMKSLLVSVFWPAYVWLTQPHKRLLCFANEGGLTVRDGLRMRQIVTDDWYLQLMTYAHKTMGTPLWKLSDAQNTKTLFANTSTGYRQNLGIKAAVTGKRGDIHIVDDPYDAKQALLGSAEQINRRMTDVVEIYRGVLASRVNNDKEHARVTIMQRLHQLDLAGHLIRNGVECIVLPTEYDPTLSERLPGNKKRLLAHPDDPRAQKGELLNPRRRPAEVVAKLKGPGGMGAKAYSAQHDQRPTPAEGSIFKRPWFDRRYEESPMVKALMVDRIIQSIDCNFKKTSDGSHAVIQTWGITGHGAATLWSMLWQVKARWSWLELEANGKRQITQWNAHEVWIEDKANGPALIESLTHSAKRLDGMPILVSAFDPGTRDKVERAQLGSAPAMEAGRVEFPNATDAPWLDEFIENHLAFPDGADDDEIDAASQFFIRARGVQNNDPMEAVERTIGWMFHANDIDRLILGNH